MSKQATIWTVVIVAVLIILALVFWSKNDAEVQPTPAENTGEVTGIVGENEINIGQQTAGSRTALVSFVFLQGDGYVVVHAKDANGRPGAVLGSSPLLTPGQSSDVSVPLNEAMVSGKSYIAMLHLDNNADAVFSETADPVAQNGDGDEVLVEFSAKAATQ